MAVIKNIGGTGSYEAVFRKQQDAPAMTGEEMLHTAEALTAMLGG